MALAPAALTRRWRRKLVGILTLAAGVLTFGAPAAAAPNAWQSPASIRAAARDAVGATGTARVEAVAVDERLKLPACGTPLATEMHRPLQRGQGTVAVQCVGPEPWRLFVPVRVTEEVPVLVLRRNIQPGDVLTATDLEVQRHASTSLPYDYLSEPDQALGLAARRSQTAGTILQPGALESPPGVERGALVTLIASGGPVTVKAEGIALEPGRLRQRIRVRSQSGRVLEGTVEAPGLVRVGL